VLVHQGTGLQVDQGTGLQVDQGIGTQDLVVGQQGKGWLVVVAWRCKVGRLLVVLKDCMTGQLKVQHQAWRMQVEVEHI
jgi:hypothetical protein